jgi:hypothetical protein
VGQSDSGSEYQGELTHWLVAIFQSSRNANPDFLTSE